MSTTAPSLSGQSASRSITFTYDKAGRLTQTEYGTGRTTQSYDAAGNLLQQQTVLGSAEAFVYIPLILRRR